MLCYLAVGQWNQGAQPGGEQTSTQVTIPKDVSSIVGQPLLVFSIFLFFCLFVCFFLLFY